VHKDDRSEEVRFGKGDVEPGIVKAIVLLHCNWADKALAQSALDGRGYMSDELAYIANVACVCALTTANRHVTRTSVVKIMDGAKKKG
jgi:hypothetical protein